MWLLDIMRGWVGTGVPLESWAWPLVKDILLHSGIRFGNVIESFEMWSFVVMSPVGIKLLKCPTWQKLIMFECSEGTELINENL